MKLSSEQIAFYRQQGYLVIERVFDGLTLTRLRKTIDEFIEQSRSETQNGKVFDLAPDHSAAQPKVRRIKNPQTQHAIFDEVMRSQEIVDRVADLLGGTVRFDHAKLNFKPANGNAKIEWHQDWAFYPHTNDDILAVGVMIEDCTVNNGPLMVIPDSHNGPIYNHHHNGVFAGGVAATALTDLIPGAVKITAPAGSISIHHVRMLHGSTENTTNSDRPLLLFSYAAVDAFPVFVRPNIHEFDSRILKGEPTTLARMVELPVLIPEPQVKVADSIFEDQIAMT